MFYYKNNDITLLKTSLLSRLIPYQDTSIADT